MLLRYEKDEYGVTQAIDMEECRFCYGSGCPNCGCGELTPVPDEIVAYCATCGEPVHSDGRINYYYEANNCYHNDGECPVDPLFGEPYESDGDAYNGGGYLTPSAFEDYPDYSDSDYESYSDSGGDY